MDHKAAFGEKKRFRRTLIYLFGSLLFSAVLSWVRATGSLAGGFLVAVVGFALSAVVWFAVILRFPLLLVLRDSFALTCAMDFAPIKRTCTA